MRIREKILSYIKQTRWTIGFVEESLDEVIKGNCLKIHYIKHNYNDRWFADPFILDVDEQFIYLLVEEYYDPIKRGYISLLTIERNGYKLIKTEKVLELSSHLSFPAIKREGKDIFIYPENGRGQGLIMYEYNIKKCTCTSRITISNRPLADAIITDVFGEDLLFTTCMPTHNGNQLTVYHYDKGHITPYTTCIFDGKIARNAGDWFRIENKVYRPAQDCNKVYGGAVILQEVCREGDCFSFKKVRRITSQSRKYSLGLHTFNHFKGVIVVDAHGYRHNAIAKLFNILKIIIGRK